MMPLDNETAQLDRERLGAVWAAFGCAQNPDDFKESVREQMWSQVLDMARESAQQSGRLYRENGRLIEEIRRLRNESTDQIGESNDKS